MFIYLQCVTSRKEGQTSCDAEMTLIWVIAFLANQFYSQARKHWKNYAPEFKLSNNFSSNKKLPFKCRIYFIKIFFLDRD